MTRPRRITGALLCLGLLSSCTGERAAPLRDSAAAVSLADTQFALYLSYQTADLAAGAGGQLVLVDSEGQKTTYATSGMDQAEIAWTPSGLFLSDADNDYLLGDGLTVIPSPKPDLQEGILYIPSTDTHVAVYNDGFTDQGYREQVVSTASGKATSVAVEGAYWVRALCGQDVYGVAPRSGRYLTSQQKADWDQGVTGPGQMLARLHPLPHGSEHVVGSHDSPDSGEPRGNAPCWDNTLAYPAFLAGPYSTNATGSAVLRTWDVSTGQMSDRPLVAEDGTRFDIDTDGMITASMLGLDDRQRVVWLLRDGRVLATNPSTGVTVETYHITLEGSDPDLVVAVDDSTLWALEKPFEAGGRYVVHEVDLASGRELSRVTLPTPSRDLDRGMVLRGFAVRPQGWVGVASGS